MSSLFVIFCLALLQLFIAGTLNYEIEETKSLRPRKSAPLFKAKAVLHDKFIDISLEQYINQGKWIVLLFYPFDYTFVCPTEIISFSDNNSEFLEIGAQVLALSTDSHHTHLGII